MFVKDMALSAPFIINCDLFRTNLKIIFECPLKALTFSYPIYKKTFSVRTRRSEEALVQATFSGDIEIPVYWRSFTSLHYQFRLKVSTVCELVCETCEVIWEKLQPLVLPQPTSAQWLGIAEKFNEVANFPNCIGALGGKHICIQKPVHSGSPYYNYKTFFSIVLMAIADARYRFVAVDIGAYGRTNFSRLFKESNMGNCLYNNSFNIPPSRPLPGTEGPSLPLVLVGDEAFQLGTNLMKPYSCRNLNSSRRIFNYRLSRARRYVECTFGLMTSKWRVLLTAIQLKPENVDSVVKACVALHNFVARHEPLLVDQNDCESHLTSIEARSVRSTTATMQIREQFTQFFVSEQAQIPWQDNQ
ncbi:uncharacterized protein ACNLHF_011866 [Anomaloglossus baeobatrachus]